MKTPSYTLTNESITIVWDRKPYTVQKSAPQYAALRTAILMEDWASVPQNLSMGKKLETWAKGRFNVEDNVVRYDGQPLPESLNARMLAMAEGGEDPAPLFKFWERVQRNPSYRSVTQLWNFLNNIGIPLTEDGCFLAYKAVKSDYKDCHTGTVNNTPGTVNEMPRNRISDDPEKACHYGFHVGALEYARGFNSGGRIVICKVDPEHVVCVPNDASHQKMRVCKYEVVGLHNGEFMPSTTHREDDHSEYDDQEDDEQEDFFAQRDEEKAREAERDAFLEEDAEDEHGVDDCDACGESFCEGECENEDVDDFASVIPIVPTPKTQPFSPESTAEAAAEIKKMIPTPGVRRVGTLTTVKVGSKKKKKPSNKTLFAALDKADVEDLMEQSIEVLRAYAAKKLKIVGASKIPGGKTALVNAIINAR